MYKSEKKGQELVNYILLDFFIIMKKNSLSFLYKILK
jgi:hypothetical protein